MEIEDILEIEVNENISILDEVKFQARVLVPIIRGLRKELGEQYANDIVYNALRESSRSAIQKFGADIQGSPSEKWASFSSAIQTRIGNDIDLDWIKQNTSEIEFNITGCRYADLFRQLGEPDLGSVLLCEPDIYVAELGAPEVEFERTQTIMQGAKYCDFRYRVKNTPEGK